MAQTGYSPILIYGSTTTGNTPAAGNLTTGTSGVELAINATDGKLFYKDNAGVVQTIATKAGAAGTFSNVTITGGSINGTTIGATTASTGAFTTLSASSTVSGTGFSTYLASPPAIGSTAANTGAFTTLSASGTTTLSGGTANGVAYLNGSKVVTTGSALTFDGTNLAGTGSMGTTIAGKTAQFNAVGGSIYASFGDGTKTWRIGTGIQSAGVFSLYNATDAVNAFNVTATGQVQTNIDATVYGVTVGRGAGAVSTNTAVGASALASTSTGFQNVAIGASAAQYQTNNNNTAVGYNAMVGVNGSSSGGSNVAVGSNSMAGLLTGNFNVAIGQQALQANTTASNNTAVGYQAGYAANTLGDNTFVGYQAGVATTGNRNTIVGFLAGGGLTSGTFNNLFGTQAGQAITTGGKNTILGSYSGNQGGLDIRTSSNYIVLSDGDGNPRGVFDSSGNFLVGKTAGSLANTGFVAQSNGYVSSSLSGTTSATDSYNLYSTGASAYRFYVDMAGTIHATSIVITAISDERLKENVRNIDTGLNDVLALKPRRFDWKEGKGQDRKNVAGFIAQEFEEVFPECIGTTKAGADGIEYKNINYETLIPTLVKAIQEQQALIQTLTDRITALEGK